MPLGDEVTALLDDERVDSAVAVVEERRDDTLPRFEVGRSAVFVRVDELDESEFARVLTFG